MSTDRWEGGNPKFILDVHSPHTTTYCSIIPVHTSRGCSSPGFPAVFVSDHQDSLGNGHPSLVDKTVAKVHSEGWEMDAGSQHWALQHTCKCGAMAYLWKEEDTQQRRGCDILKRGFIIYFTIADNVWILPLLMDYSALGYINEFNMFYLITKYIEKFNNLTHTTRWG